MANGAAEDAYDVIFPDLHDSLLAQVGAPAFASLPGGGAPVRVAILDSRPEVGASQPHDQLGHGLGMMSIIENLTCDRINGSCPVTLRPHLALNLTSANTADPVNGGFYGYQSHLARQVVEAVESWQANQPAARLVINLSVGWDTRFSVGTAHPVSDAVLAVRMALTHATCNGALVLASAGNDGGASTSAGPIEPAAWESETATCGGTARPLLVSVGGVDGEDNALHNQRLGARPKLAASGFMVAPEHATRRLGPFTGSSPSAAIASAAAALLWSQFPGESASGIANALRTHAVTLPDAADYCYSPPCGNIRRLSLCMAAQAAYPSAVCTTPAAGAGANPELTAAHETSFPPASQTFAGIAGAPYVPAGCNAALTPLLTDPNPPPPVAPWLLCAEEHLPFAIAAPILEPQPPPNICPPCSMYLANPAGSLILEGELHLFIDADFVGVAYAVSLDLVDGAGDVVESIDLSRLEDMSGNPLSDGLVAGDAATVEMNDIPLVDYESAVVNWLTDMNSPRTALQSAVLIR